MPATSARTDVCVNSTLPVAPVWFAHEKISADITRFWEPHVAPVFQCNIWLVRGRDRHLLIDGGMGISSLSLALTDWLDKPVVAIATHSHMDHVGALNEFVDRRLHPLEQGMASRPGDYPVLCSEHWPAGMKEQIERAGYEVPDLLIDALPFAGFDPEQFHTPGCATCQALQAGQMIDLGDRWFEVLHLPGHSPGSIGLWEAASGTLFSGDAVYDGPLLDGFPESDIQDYRRTMQRLLELPANIVHAGHDPSFGRERLRQLAEGYLKRNS